jgi:hypothetical protein
MGGAELLGVWRWARLGLRQLQEVLGAVKLPHQGRGQGHAAQCPPRSEGPSCGSGRSCRSRWSALPGPQSLGRMAETWEWRHSGPNGRLQELILISPRGGKLTPQFTDGPRSGDRGAGANIPCVHWFHCGGDGWFEITQVGGTLHASLPQVKITRGATA